MKKVNFVSQKMLQRVFHILVEGDGKGAAFVMDTDKGRFLITAKHLFENNKYPNEMNIKIHKEEVWEQTFAKIYYHDDANIDIAVIKTDYFNGMVFGDVKYSSKMCCVSQNMFMLGFPYGIATDLYERNNGHPIPLVKQGCLSGISEAGNYLWIDWDNNQGFSGGPIVYRKYEKEGYSEEEYIAGVIKGYRKHVIEVYDKDGNDTGMYAIENSGIGLMYRIESALEIIEKIE